mmetsp:Transcript_110216/g.318531  ORF Transcript_110216/g.318531 Transcript_110216/m.318531 type:complete len:206 (+) Transcript_110216:501-1118(+)
MPPLPRVPVVRSPHGPPLPVDRELRGLQEPQVLLPPFGLFVAHLLDHRRNDDGVHLEGSDRRVHADRAFFVGVRHDVGGHHDDVVEHVLPIARVANVEGDDDHRVLREALSQQRVERAGELRSGALLECEVGLGPAPLSLVAADLAAGGVGLVLRTRGGAGREVGEGCEVQWDASGRLAERARPQRQARSRRRTDGGRTPHQRRQ